MAFTIEPGIYIRQAALDNLSKTPENLAFIQNVQPMVDKYKDIGVRIEDSFIMIDGRAKSISVGIPRTVEEIEAFMKTR
jgi:Xaa-Pro aminopeptidase